MPLDRLIRSQAGVFSRQQALECGFSQPQITRRLRTGLWLRITPTVYAPATAVLSAPSYAHAAVLAAGPGSAVGFQTAAGRWGLPIHRDGRDGKAHVIVPSGRRLRLPARITVHRVPLDPRDSLISNGVRITTPARTVEDCLRILSEREAAQLLDRSLQQGWITLADLRTRIDASAGRTGSAQLRRLSRRADPDAASEAEHLLLRIFRRARITGWTANYRHPSGFVLDVAFPRQRLAVEVDGWAFHSDTERFQRDRDKQNLLVRERWTVLRFTWSDLRTRPDYVVATVLAALIAAA